MPIIKETFSQRLLKIRKVRGLSQYDLADMTGISQRMIVHYEKHAKNPPSRSIIKLAKALNVTIDELVGHSPTKIKEEFSNKKVINKMKILEQLPHEDQNTVINLIDNLNKRNSK